MNIAEDLEILNEWISYDPWNGEFFYKKSPNRNKPAGSKAGTTRRSGRHVIHAAGKRYQANRVAFILYHGWLPKEHIDHCDGDPSNNRINNLRPANPCENQYNKRISKANSSGVKGVTRCKKTGRFHARLKVSKVQKFVGSYMTLEEAEKAVRRARIEYHGEFARHQ